MPEETLRQRVERIYRFEVMEDPTAMRLAGPEPPDSQPDLTETERVMVTAYMAKALRVALFDLAEQLDTLLGRHLKPE
jgi:hypothetical protein